MIETPVTPTGVIAKPGWNYTVIDKRMRELNLPSRRKLAEYAGAANTSLQNQLRDNKPTLEMAWILHQALTIPLSALIVSKL